MDSQAKEISPCPHCGEGPTFHINDVQVPGCPSNVGLHCPNDCDTNEEGHPRLSAFGPTREAAAMEWEHYVEMTNDEE